MDSKHLKGLAKLLRAVNEAICGIDDREVVMAIVSTILDQWAANHDMTEADADRMFSDMAEVAPIKHSVAGLPPKMEF